MIKRRLYKLDHADKDEATDSSSSSSSESESEPEEEQQVDDEQVPQPNDDANQPSPPSSGSGYESEDSSEKELEYDSSGDEETAGAQFNNRAKKKSTEADYTGQTLKFNSVYKCRLCPRIVCLTEESLRAHLSSKRHARSEKLLNEGRLKLMLNSDGEIEEDQETHAERHARTVAAAQDASNKKKKNKGRQRQKLRLKRKKTVEAPEKEKANKPVEKIGDASEKAQKNKPAKTPPSNKRRKDDV